MNIVLILMVVCGIFAILAEAIIRIFERLFPNLAFAAIRASTIALPTITLFASSIWLNVTARVYEMPFDDGIGDAEVYTYKDKGDVVFAELVGMLSFVCFVTISIYAGIRKDRRSK